MRTLIILSFILCSFNSFGQSIIRIDFTPLSPDNLEVRLQHGLDQLGYTSFINYHGRRESESYDFLLQYEFKDDKILFRLFDAEQSLKKIASVNNKPTKNANNIESALYQLFNQSVKIKNDDYPVPWNAALKILKYDSSEYYIEVIGAGVHEDNDVQMMFLKTARYLTGQFKTYHKNQQVQYSMQYGINLTVYDAWKSYGYIQATKIENGPSFTTFQEEPDNYILFKQAYGDSEDLPELSAHPEKATIYIFQPITNSIANARPHVFVNDQWRAITGKGEYIMIDVSPGNYELAVQLNGKKIYKNTKRLPVTLLQGEAKSFEIKFGAINTSEIIEVSEFDARQKLAEMERCIECVY